MYPTSAENEIEPSRRPIETILGPFYSSSNPKVFGRKKFGHFELGHLRSLFELFEKMAQGVHLIALSTLRTPIYFVS